MASDPSEQRRRLAVRVTPDALRRVRAGHPWIFDGSITGVRPEDGRAGDVAVVFDERRRFAAIGLYDPESPIAVRVLHAGGPVPLDRAFWADRLGAAVAARADLATSGHTTGYRLVHGENDRLPGLVVDRYDTTLVIKVYTSAWLPHLDEVRSVLGGLCDPERVVLRLGRNVAEAAAVGDRHDGEVLAGPPPPGPVRFLEHGLTFEADVLRGQKTGHFLDQRDNRRRVRDLAAGARVLDVFCCTGGFSVYAAAGGARSVHSVDLAPGAIANTRRNLSLNAHVPAVANCRTEDTVGDAFEVMGDLARAGRTYDLVVVDPPSFASRGAHVERALRAYGRLTALAVRLVAPGGRLVQASCSARIGERDFAAVVRQSAADAGRALREVRVTGHPADHPIGFPEGAYLKAVFARVP